MEKVMKVIVKEREKREQMEIFTSGGVFLLRDFIVLPKTASFCLTKKIYRFSIKKY